MATGHGFKEHDGVSSKVFVEASTSRVLTEGGHVLSCFGRSTLQFSMAAVNAVLVEEVAEVIQFLLVPVLHSEALHLLCESLHDAVPMGVL